MIRRNQAFLNLVNMVSDALLIFFSYSLAMFLRVEVMGGESQLPLTSWPYQLVAARSSSTTFWGCTAPTG